MVTVIVESGLLVVDPQLTSRNLDLHLTVAARDGGAVVSVTIGAAVGCCLGTAPSVVATAWQHRHDET